MPFLVLEATRSSGSHYRPSLGLVTLPSNRAPHECRNRIVLLLGLAFLAIVQASFPMDRDGVSSMALDGQIRTLDPGAKIVDNRGCSFALAVYR